ncbi:MAG: DUF2207 domain-containing protein [Weeksellaceae bacterium]
MKRLILGIFTAILLCVPFTVSAQFAEERIDAFDTQITVNTDGTMNVQETITYNFGNESRHGIFRTIPTTKTNTEGKEYRMKFDVQSIEDENGKSYTYDESNSDNILTLKIGDADKYVDGVKVYIIRYTVSGALTYFSDHDEIYWNATGTEWQVPIMQASAMVRIPSWENTDETQTTSGACYTGTFGATGNDCTMIANQTQFVSMSNRPLGIGEGLTIAALFPKGIVEVLEPELVVGFFETWWGKLIGLGIILIVLLWYVVYPLWLPIKWFIYGRDPSHNKGKLTAHYDPPKTKSGRPLTPAETGVLIDEHAGAHEISAILIDLAQRGYMKIVEKKKDEFELVKQELATKDDELQSFESIFLKKIFAKKDVIKLKDADLYTATQKVQEDLYASLVSEGYFPESPQKVRNYYAIIATLAGTTFNFPLMLIAAIFGRIMPRKTWDGVHAANLVRSMKGFLTSQERQLAFQAKNQMFFEQLLPFAIAFGVEKIWAKRFEDLTMSKPEWFESSTSHFTPSTFTSHVNSSISSFQSAATASSSSSGFSSGGSSGSSGGGGGGGGGGSW